MFKRYHKLCKMFLQSICSELFHLRQQLFHSKQYKMPTNRMWRRHCQFPLTMRRRQHNFRRRMLFHMHNLASLLQRHKKLPFLRVQHNQHNLHHLHLKLFPNHPPPMPSHNLRRPPAQPPLNLRRRQHSGRRRLLIHMPNLNPMLPSYCQL